MNSALSQICIKFIEFYQIYLSFDHGLLMVFAPGGACKFPVTCSEYTKQRILEMGVWKGVYLGIIRIISCR